MNFLSDYWHYHSAYEIPRNYALFSGIALLGSIVHRKVIFLHGDLEIFCNLYVGLIGPQGNSKSTCCSFAKGFYRETVPDGKIGPSRTSPEMLVKLMSEEDFTRVFTNHHDEHIEVRPYAFFINEFKNFVGRSPFDMIVLLTDIYDEKAYDGSTLARGVEYIYNPAVNVLMCENPDWFVRNIKGDVITGGISRRFILVNETYADAPKPDIILTPEHLQAKERFKKRLLDVRNSAIGEFKWGDAHSDYVRWYGDNFKRRVRELNPMMQGYLKSKNVQLYKIMMLLDVSSDAPSFVFNKSLLEEALALLDIIEVRMPELAIAAGRNELLSSQKKLLALVDRNGGWMPEKKVIREMEVEMTPMETISTIRHLVDTDQLIKKVTRIRNLEGELIERHCLFAPETFNRMRQSGEIQIS